MFELSFSDAFLLCWAIVATMFAFKFKDENDKAQIAISRLLDDDDLRDTVVADYREWKEEQIKNFGK